MKTLYNKPSKFPKKSSLRGHSLYRNEWECPEWFSDNNMKNPDRRRNLIFGKFGRFIAQRFHISGSYTRGTSTLKVIYLRAQDEL